MWNPNDFCDADTGFDYVFTKMNAIYGGSFENNWRNVDPEIVRQTWKDICGRNLTYRPKMDYALAYLNPDRPPSALAFQKLLNEGPLIPNKPQTLITRQPTIHEQIMADKAKHEALTKLRELQEQMRVQK
jgi:hypothetical protein